MQGVQRATQRRPSANRPSSTSRPRSFAQRNSEGNDGRRFVRLLVRRNNDNLSSIAYRVSLYCPVACALPPRRGSERGCTSFISILERRRTADGQAERQADRQTDGRHRQHERPRVETRPLIGQRATRSTDGGGDGAIPVGAKTVPSGQQQLVSQSPNNCLQLLR
ncbi:hypothetical protein BKA80DRAFT_71168 [Phyllosticta citrichinensis]